MAATEERTRGGLFLGLGDRHRRRGWASLRLDDTRWSDRLGQRRDGYRRSGTRGRWPVPRLPQPGNGAAVDSPRRILMRLRDVVEGSYRSDVACASNAPNSGQLPDVLGVHLSLTREFLE